VGSTEVLTAKTDKKGEFKLKSLANGQYKIELSKQGLATVAETFEVKGDKAPALNLTMAPPVDPSVQINAELNRARALAQENKMAESRQVCESLLQKHPELTQCHAWIANTYLYEGQAAKGIPEARIALEKEPTNVSYKLLLSDVLMDSGQKEESTQVLMSLDMTQVPDPRAYYNVVITLYNDSIQSKDPAKANEAVALLTKMESVYKDAPEIYYYRGKANIAANKPDAAKADFEKFVAVGKADSKEVADAKKMLEQLSKK
jgi:predicted Zn-dependent protease